MNQTEVKQKLDMHRKVDLNFSGKAKETFYFSSMSKNKSVSEDPYHTRKTKPLNHTTR